MLRHMISVAFVCLFGFLFVCLFGFWYSLSFRLALWAAKLASNSVRILTLLCAHEGGSQKVTSDDVIYEQRVVFYS